MATPITGCSGKDIPRLARFRHSLMNASANCCGLRAFWPPLESHGDEASSQTDVVLSMMHGCLLTTVGSSTNELSGMLS